MARDPVPRFRAWLLEGGVAESELAALETAIDKEIDEAVAFALESPVPDLSELHTDVLAEEAA
jgi:acetoin:2,6-dichlorophenolindophenol oxidoreductase subunit alpha